TGWSYPRILLSRCAVCCCGAWMWTRPGDPLPSRSSQRYSVSAGSADCFTFCIARALQLSKPSETKTRAYPAVANVPTGPAPMNPAAETKHSGGGQLSVELRTNSLAPQQAVSIRCAASVSLLTSVVWWALQAPESKANVAPASPDGVPCPTCNQLAPPGMT